MDTIFSTGVNSLACRINPDTRTLYTFNLGTFTCDGDQQPMLSDPVFMPTSNSGAMNLGRITIPYMSFQQLYQYNTSWSPGLNIPTTLQGDFITVPSADTVQHGFYLNMQTKSTRSTNDVTIKQWLKTNKVDIPAYHKIHDFTVTGYFYERNGYHYRDDRFKRLRWKFKTPHEQDIIENDMFEMQRAYDSTFADAQTIYTEYIDWALDDSTAGVEKVYEYIDSSREAWHNPLYNNGTIYYRVRRVSSSAWGWEGHDYAATTNTANVRSYTLPVFRMQYYADQRYWAAEDFEDSHQVEIELTILNDFYNRSGTVDYPRYSRTYWDDRAALYIQKVLVETHDTLLLRVPTEKILSAWDSIYYGDYSIYYDHIALRFTDVVNTPCVHYEYSFFSWIPRALPFRLRSPV